MKEKLFTRNFTLLLVGQASSLLGNNALKFALSMFVLEETGSATVFATILALAMAPTILLSPLGGILADRANRKSIMVALDSLSGLAVLMACLLLSLGDRVLVAGSAVGGPLHFGSLRIPHGAGLCAPDALWGTAAPRQRGCKPNLKRPPLWSRPFLGSVLYTALGIQPIFLGAVACFFLTAAAGGLSSAWTIDVPAGRPGWALRCGKTSRKAWTSSSGRSPASASCSCWPLW